MHRNLSIRLCRLGSIVTALSASLTLADSFPIEEPPGESRVYQVTARVEVTGQLEFAVDGKKAISRPLKVTSTHEFLERRLTGAGRDSEALRSMRQYSQSESAIEVDKDRTSLRLGDARRIIVAQGRREGVQCYSPRGPITRGEIDLLQMPGDSLAMLGLLPRSKVEVGEKWNPDSWVIQTLANVDAVSKSDLACEVESATSDAAVVKFSGSIEGAAAGAATTIRVSGKYVYDRGEKHIKRLELEQKEKRTIGAVTPGMDVTAKVTIDRSPSVSSGELTAAAAEKVPLEPDATLLALNYETPWGVRFPHDRDWHIFQQTSEAAVMRLLDKGSLITQCNLRKIAPATAGKHTPEETFQADIQKSLGESFKSFASAEQVKTDDGRFLYRVSVLGEVKAGEGEKAKVTPMQWIYYLCAAPSGEQTSILFALEPSLVDRLGNRDLAIVKSLQFVKREPTKAQ